MSRPIEKYKGNARRSKYLCELMEQYVDILFVYERNGKLEACDVEAKICAIKIELDTLWDEQMDLLDKIKPFENRILAKLIA